MIYLLLDTCTWLNCFIPKFRKKIIPSLQNLLDHDKISLLVPDIVHEEFKRKENDFIEKCLKSDLSHVKAVQELKLLLKSADRIPFETYLDEIKKALLSRKKEDIIFFSNCNSLLNHKNTIQLERTDEILADATKLGLEKKAPFHRNKNSTADAVIILQFKKFLTSYNPKETTKEVYFVTFDGDFADPSDPNSAHSDFQEIFKYSNIKWSNKISEVINKIDPTLITAAEIEADEEIKRLEEGLCPDGKHTFTNSHGAWLRGARGLTWHLGCGKCKAMSDTFDDDM